MTKSELPQIYSLNMTIYLYNHNISKTDDILRHIILN